MPRRLDIKRKLAQRSERVKSVNLHPTEPWILAILYSGALCIWNYQSQWVVKRRPGARDFHFVGSREGGCMQPFPPAVRTPSAAGPSAPKPSSGGRNPLTDWTKPETFVLLDVWGDRFLQHGRKSLRSEEWQEVAEKVSKVSRVERTDTQCRNRLDTLKKKYKKEKIKFPEMDGGTSGWVYFKRMDKLMSSPPQQGGISCGLDSGEYVSTNCRIYSNRANGLDETRDSPGNTESTEEGSDRPHVKKRRKGRDSGESSSFRLLADSLHKFSNIYEKIENDRRQQMVELEKMRMDFQKEIETQRRQVLEKLQSEISKLDQTNDENDGSSENGM